MRLKVQMIWSGVLAFTFGIGGLAHADTLSFSESLSNGTQSATASFTFDDTANTLSVVLKNTMTTNGGPQWLTGLFWNLAGADGLNITPHVADANLRVVGSMITLSGTTQTPYTEVDIGHYWAYRDDLSSGDYGSFLDSAFGGTTRQYGLGAAGFDVFGQSDILNFIDGAPIPQPDGTDGGILADITGLQVPGGHEGTPFALESLVFLYDLDDAGNDFLLSNFGDLAVTDAAFVFGTGFDETVLIPLPPAVWVGAIGLAGVVAVRRRNLLA